MQSRSDAYAVGETVVAVVDGERGTVTRISLERQYFEVAFGEHCTALFPMDTDRVRKAMPWET